MKPSTRLTDRASRIPRDPYERPQAIRPAALRLDGNEGSTPDPALLAAAAAGGTDLVRNYPTTNDLASVLARRFDIAADQVVITAGADDALDRVCRSFLEPGRTAVMPVPTFEMLHRFLAIAGGEPILVQLSGAFPIDEILTAVRPDTALIAIVSPNNPTGAIVTKDEFAHIAAGAPDTVILLDHAYVEYADEDLTQMALTFPNVVVVRTLSKAWGLAGCRVGYALASAEVATVLRNAGNPYPVAALSLAIARVRLARGADDLASHVATVHRQRDHLTARLNRLGAPTTKSQANFVFPDFGDRAEFAYETLQFAGIVTRRFANRNDVASHLRISMPGDATGLARLENALDLALDPQAILLDLDGVVADVRQSYRECVLRVAASYGVAVTDKDVQAEKRSGNANNDWELTRRLVEARGVAAPIDDVIDRYQQLYLGNGKTPGLREGEQLLTTHNLLAGLSDGRKLGIVTGRPREEAQWFLARYGLVELIDAMVCLEDGPLKPEPFAVTRALELLECRRAWMVGDTPDDMRAAAAAGVVPIGVVAPGDDPGLTLAALREAGAVVVIPDLEVLKGWLP